MFITRKSVKIMGLIFPLAFLKYFFNLFALSLGKGFDMGSLDKEFKYVKQFLGKDVSLLIDVGANYGAYTEELIENYPESKVYLFEPQKYLYNFLINKYEGQDKIKIFNIALDELSKETLLNKSFDGDGNASIYKRAQFNNNTSLQEKISCKRFDEIITDKRIDFVKIDVEGNEMKVLKGMGKVITKIRVIQIEFGGTWIDSRFFYKDLFYFLKSKNFSLYRMAPGNLIKIDTYDETDEYFTYTNFVATNNSIL
tara:strand:- start:173 stop:934 length:762 start_codon:yes stop_codon:yes gene_type:complete